MNHLTGTTICKLMARHHKTIGGIAKQWGITQKRVREVRANGVQGEAWVMDWMQFTTGNPRAGWEAVAKVHQ